MGQVCICSTDDASAQQSAHVALCPCLVLSCRREAEGLPGVVRIEVDPTITERSRARQTAYMPAVQEIPACPEEYLPCESWANDVCFQFSNFRAVMQLTI